MKFSRRWRFGTFCRRNTNKRPARHERKLDVIAEGGVMMKQEEKLGLSLIQQHQRRSDRESEEGGRKTEPLFGKISAEWNRGWALRRRAQTCFWSWKARDRDLTCEPRRGGREDRRQGRRAMLKVERQTSVWRKLISDQPNIKASKLPYTQVLSADFQLVPISLFPRLHKQAVSPKKN